MSKIDIIKRIVNTSHGKEEIGLPDEKIQVSMEAENYALIYSSGYIVIPESKFETIIIRNILVGILPDDYKIEVTQFNSKDEAYCTKCSLHSIRNHHTMTFAYGASHLEATGKCLLEALKLIENGEVSYAECN